MRRNRRSSSHHCACNVFPPVSAAASARSERVRVDDDRVSGEFLASRSARFGFLEPFVTHWPSIYGTEGQRFESSRARCRAAGSIRSASGRRSRCDDPRLTHGLEQIGHGGAGAGVAERGRVLERGQRPSARRENEGVVGQLGAAAACDAVLVGSTAATPARTSRASRSAAICSADAGRPCPRRPPR
jgi:hypothetical protein